MKKILTFIVASLVVFLLGCSKEEQPVTQNFKEFTQGEEIILKGVAQGEITLVRKNDGFVIKGDEGKVIMIDIFGTFCPPCQKEAPEIMHYQIENIDKFKIIGLTHFENVTNEYVQKEFVQKYNAYYFITNDQKINNRLVEQIVRDIDYKHEIALPFKVVIKDGKYQILTDIDSGKFGVHYYLGGIKMNSMKQDLERIYTTN
ncbi:TlpA family protein disulfide reductase [Campylobacter sp. faydin G-24]|uniref:TlpA family protein disulfide reductase n=1 Tax=Campylobacter anatolicus TaxID=2829105 RepID=A0ABS5HHN9_9BACT|nr:redoxin family protein [Campylobacter anatolicus]MBR8462109.1 TlpA family protein disulfide reductase [Campylobacter anatolicus]MBR8463773.1 TlpA family protein disulfide reductase [Campylobacter anatolicus]MBR8464805.1 TlpA family protein disulfide reductase [Campylobacter anatolicus]